MSEQTTKQILFVDDDSFLLDMYALKFSKAGYEVKTCDSSEVALKLLRDGFSPNIMLIDVVMPGIDGLELAATIQKEKLAPGAVIIMLTNQSAPEDIAKARKANVDGYIVKATTIPSEVVGEVEKIWNSKKQ
jgi:two-component system phosphate regulon response regulator PhoB